MIVTANEVPTCEDWLSRQTEPVIAVSERDQNCTQMQLRNTDVIVTDFPSAQKIADRINQAPIPALQLVQVLRVTENISVEQGLLIESLAYSTLQSGRDYQNWLAGRPDPPQHISGTNGEPILLERREDIVYARFNRPEFHNALTIEMRNALLEVLTLLEVDTSITQLKISALGKCFSIGGELKEFGLAPDPAAAHGIRCKTNPAYLFARHSPRIHCHLHGACIGSGIELPAFSFYLTANRKTFFQLPEYCFGLMPGAGGCISIARRIGRHRTALLVLSGKKINAKTALEWGLIDAIVD
ncbi:enoyl-CoA hydratase/isomerase family protein [Microbulbifer spongiae]|uniref:Enoyl-CoA hydratase/isomerase family protein n=1 Tax=Microbulbifer spongiae TaxID=2944933 RepID=A0ABY9E7M0_9GAMM|nr:enoyl-CoA hydratase/isomerase family protein [Microbulbifer sp. MI-G]WKD49029.1 enoyl-CoA hydratase/isomerase family protein [Microbulbifer sp. MI-G]